MRQAKTSGGLPPSFPITRWSVVLAASRKPSRESAEALEIICRDYWYPLYAYARRCGQSPHDAQDITQEFFCRLLEKGWLGAADRGKGRLRTFLITALKRFMVSDWRRVSAQRRGGGQQHVPLDTAFAESRMAADDSSNLQPEEAFDRQWAITLNNLTLERLEKEFESAGKAGEFEVLKESLMVVRESVDYATAAVRLGWTEGAARVAVHRLRKRYREIYREEISQTLSEGEDVDNELRYLAQALARS